MEQLEQFIQQYWESEDTLVEQIDDGIVSGDFLDDDWRDEYDDEYEAYQETGRGEVEGQILATFLQDIANKFYNESVAEALEDDNVMKTIIKHYPQLDI